MALNTKSTVKKLWAEFLFTRAFEYETLLTPDEVVLVLAELEKQHSWWLRTDKLKHRVTYLPYGDKGGQFKISLLSQWGNNLEIQSTTGTLTVNPATGITVVKGFIRYSSFYYILTLSLFLFNVYLHLLTGNVLLSGLFFALIPFIWYLLYHERNKLANRIDEVIITAKSKRSAITLAGDESDKLFNNEEQFEKGYLSS